MIQGWDGNVRMGLGKDLERDETTVVYFAVPPDDVGKYYHIDITPEPGRRMQGSVVRGERQGRVGRMNDDDSAQLVAGLTTSIGNPVLEFKVWDPGNYTLVLNSLTDAFLSWMKPMVAPHGMQVHYTISKSLTSKAAEAGQSVYIAKDDFPATFLVEGLSDRKLRPGGAPDALPGHRCFLYASSRS